MGTGFDLRFEETSSTPGCNKDGLANIRVVSELIRYERCHVSTRGHKRSVLEFQRGGVSCRRPIRKRRGTHKCPLQRTGSHNIFDSEMFGHDLAEDERAQNVLEQ